MSPEDGTGKDGGRAGCGAAAAGRIELSSERRGRLGGARVGRGLPARQEVSIRPTRTATLHRCYAPFIVGVKDDEEGSSLERHWTPPRPQGPLGPQAAIAQGRIRTRNQD